MSPTMCMGVLLNRNSKGHFKSNNSTANGYPKVFDALDWEHETVQPSQFSTQLYDSICEKQRRKFIRHIPRSFVAGGTGVNQRLSSGLARAARRNAHPHTPLTTTLDHSLWGSCAGRFE